MCVREYIYIYDTQVEKEFRTMTPKRSIENFETRGTSIQFILFGICKLSPRQKMSHPAELLLWQDRANVYRKPFKRS